MKGRKHCTEKRKSRVKGKYIGQLHVSAGHFPEIRILWRQKEMSTLDVLNFTH